MKKFSLEETLVYKKELILKSTTEDALEENEFLLSRTLFDKEGRVISEIQYDSDGHISQEHLYTYDENGFLLEEMLREEDGFVAEHKTFEPDEKGRIAKEMRHYMDGSFDTITCSYNEEGLLSKKVSVDPDGDTESTEEYTYTGGRLTHYILKDGDDEVLTEKSMVYDDDGNVVELTEYDASEDTTLRREMEYYPSGNRKLALTYNSKGQLVEKISLRENEKGQPVQMTEETHHKKNTVNMSYDAAGNVILQEEFDKNGELISKVERTFDEQQRLVSSEVFIHGAGRGPSRNYTLRQEYKLRQ
ncbi:MAG: hypothetical protein ACOCXV_03210 [Bacteroidota bacterium]